MRVLTFLFFSVLLSLPSLQAQTVGGTEVSSFDQTYLVVRLQTKGINMKDRFWASIDYGQGIREMKPKESIIMDEKGEMITFEGVAQLLNFMEKYNYHFYREFHKQMGNLTANVQTLYVFKKE